MGFFPGFDPFDYLSITTTPEPTCPNTCTGIHELGAWCGGDPCNLGTTVGGFECACEMTTAAMTGIVVGSIICALLVAALISIFTVWRCRIQNLKQEARRVRPTSGVMSLSSDTATTVGAHPRHPPPPQQRVIAIPIGGEAPINLHDYDYDVLMAAAHHNNHHSSNGDDHNNLNQIGGDGSGGDEDVVTGHVVGNQELRQFGRPPLRTVVVNGPSPIRDTSNHIYYGQPQQYYPSPARHPATVVAVANVANASGHDRSTRRRTSPPIPPPGVVVPADPAAALARETNGDTETATVFIPSEPGSPSVLPPFVSARNIAGYLPDDADAADNIGAGAAVVDVVEKADNKQKEESHHQRPGEVTSDSEELQTINVVED